MSETSRRTGALNPNWKGGRTVTPHGYVLIKMPEHPNADVRGYVYEHRLVASEAIGRALGPSEPVHHVNHCKTDNAPGNLEVMPSLAHHRVRHRQRDDLRLPDEANPLISCACGCEARFARFDTDGRPRRYVSGHNPQDTPTRASIMCCLLSGPRSKREIVDQCGTSVAAVSTALWKMKRAGIVRRVSHGVWRLENLNG